VTGWLAPVEAALASVEEPVPFFFRDDDAGWDDVALWALLDVLAGAGVVVDVAAIPDALGATAARELAARAADGSVRVHQHGRSHANHEVTGRSCEFGPARSATAQAADVADGRARLEELLGRPVDPVFTPPWNRCTRATADAVLAAGHAVLSRDVSAGCLDVPGLVEVPVAVDWSGRRRGVPLTPADRAEAIARRVAAAAPVGVMLHHAVLDGRGRRDVRALLDLVAAVPTAEATTILDLATRVPPRSGCRR
jgi:peptidoglycan/xylan/chitin deacetylase (PgdA/CDA1 family)